MSPTPKPQRKVSSYLVQADAFEALLAVMGSFPYKQVAPVLARVSRATTPVYEPLAAVKRPAPEGANGSAPAPDAGDPCDGRKEALP